jgi:ParB-like chromosome segregation protein Spo0J
MPALSQYQSHPFADAFPMMTDQEHAELVADIKANGLEELIRLYDGKILDGRNRYRAVLELGLNLADYIVENDCLICTDKEALAYVISKNLVRRHLTTSQRAMVAADLATLSHGQRKSDTSNDVSQADAAKLLHVSLPTTQRARKVIEKGPPELSAAVRAGDVSVSGAVAQIKAAASNGETEPAAQVAKIFERATLTPFQQRREKRRAEHFESIIHLISITCENSNRELVLTHITSEQARDAAKSISRAEKALSSLRHRITAINHNDKS